MKITIDVSDFYLDEDNNLEEGLKKYIVRDVLSQINESIKDKVEKQVTMEVKEVVEKQLYRTITSEIQNVIKTETMPSKVKSGEKVSLEEYVKQCINDRQSYNSFDDIIKRIASNLGDEMKKRYDLLFASQIVTKLNESGLLKEDVIKTLLLPPSSK